MGQLRPLAGPYYYFPPASSSHAGLLHRGNGGSAYSQVSEGMVQEAVPQHHGVGMKAPVPTVAALQGAENQAEKGRRGPGGALCGPHRSRHRAKKLQAKQLPQHAVNILQKVRGERQLPPLGAIAQLMHPLSSSTMVPGSTISIPISDRDIGQHRKLITYSRV